MIRTNLLVSMSAAMAMVLCSCGKSDIRKTAATPPQGEQAVTHRSESVPAQNETTAAKQMVAPAREQEIDQELLAREALQLELDRNAPVSQAIAQARRQILAQAYIERAASAASQASPREVRKFYKENPALFEQRRIYRVLELRTDVPDGQFGELQDTVARAKDLAAVVRWLDARKIPFDAATRNAVAERIPANTLKRLFGMRDGQLAVFPTPGGAFVVRLEQSTEIPLSEKQARTAIARYLLNRNRLTLAEAEITKLRERAKVDDGGAKRTRPAIMAQTTGQSRLLPEVPRMARTTTGMPELK